MKQWYVLATRSRAEKKLQCVLQNWKVWNLLPAYEKVRKVQRRSVVSLLPLFPGYLIARLNEEQRLQILKTNLALSVYPILNPRLFLRQLHKIMKVVKTAEHWRIVQKVGNGNRVKIVNGLLKGLEGRIVSVRDDTLFSVDIDMFGVAVEMKVSPDDCVAI